MRIRCRDASKSYRKIADQDQGADFRQHANSKISVQVKRSITIVQYYAPTEISDIVRKDTFYKQLNAVQERLPKGRIVIVTVDLNAKICIDNTLLEHAMGMHGLDDRNNGERFEHLANFQCLVIDDIVFNQRMGLAKEVLTRDSQGCRLLSLECCHCNCSQGIRGLLPKRNTVCFRDPAVK